jgi:hybrid cluster-associated redox disulfide protein
MEPTLGIHTTMDEMMRRWPPTIRVLVRHRMLCVGCPIASFHTLSDAAREHGMDEKSLRRELEAAIAAEEPAPDASCSQPLARP